MNPTHPVRPLVPLDDGAVSRRLPLQGIEYRFGLILAVFGLAFAFGLPPLQVPDESGHLFHAYDVANGHLLPGHDADGLAGVTVPLSLVKLQDRSAHFWERRDWEWTWADTLNLVHRCWDPWYGRWRWQDTKDLLKLRFTEEEGIVSLGQLSVYPFLPYLPQAAGIRMAHWLHLPPLPLFYAGRLGNLLFGVLCVMLAIRLTPIGKLLFGAIALLPMTVQQFASLSADGPTIGVTLVLVAVLLRLALASNTSRTCSLLVVLLLLLTFATTLTKPGYTALALLYFGIKPAQVGSRRRYWLNGALVLAATAASFVVFSALTRAYALDPHWLRGMPISKSGQMHFILTHPHRYFGIFLSNVARHGGEWIWSLFILGTLSAPLNLTVGYAYLFFLALLAVADRKGEELPWRLWLGGSTVTLMSFGMILTACYLWWTALAARDIEGPQGRYFIPLLPLFFLLLRNAGLRVRADERFLARMTLAVTVVFLAYAWATMVDHFYFREPPLILAPPTLLALSLTPLLLFWARLRWTMRRDETTEVSAPSTRDTSATSRAAA
jgi:uncharacterized membrane protein